MNFKDAVYIGFTTNLKDRLKVHNIGDSTPTARYNPWVVHAYFAFNTKVQALAFETYLKSNSGRAFAKKGLW